MLGIDQRVVNARRGWLSALPTVGNPDEVGGMGFRRAPGWGHWALACAAGETVGMAAAALVAGLLNAAFGEPTILGLGLVLWLGTTAGGVIEGLAIALFTYPLLRRWLSDLPRLRWVGATVAVTLFGWALGSAPSTLVAGAAGGFDTGEGQTATAGPSVAALVLVTVAGGLALGTIFGAAQAWALKPYVAHARRWVPVNALGWTLAVIMLGATLAPAGLPLLLLLLWGGLTGVLAGLTLGIVTGFFLPSLDESSPRGSTWVNRAVLGLLRSPAHGLLSGAVVEIDYVGHRTGHAYALPAQYARDDGHLVVWPGHPETKRWWRNFRQPIDVDVLVAGQRSRATARVVLPATQDYAAAVDSYGQRFTKHRPADGDPLVVLELAHSSG